MNPYHSDSLGVPSEASVSVFIQKVYQWMAIGLIVTGAVAFWTLGSPWLLKPLLKGGLWVAFLIELGLVFWLSASITKISPQTATLGFLIYSGINGMTLAPLFLIYTGASISMVFFMTAGTFAGVSLFGWATKTDLTSMGGFLLMALWGVILASLVNWFLGSTLFDLILAYGTLAIFIGLTAYDTQKLKQLHQYGGGSPQLAILGALRLYLDFINMFLALLRIFGRRNN